MHTKVKKARLNRRDLHLSARELAALRSTSLSLSSEQEALRKLPANVARDLIARAVAGEDVSASRTLIEGLISLRPEDHLSRVRRLIDALDASDLLQIARHIGKAIERLDAKAAAAEQLRDELALEREAIPRDRQARQYDDDEEPKPLVLKEDGETPIPSLVFNPKRADDEYRRLIAAGMSDEDAREEAIFRTNMVE